MKEKLKKITILVLIFMMIVPTTFVNAISTGEDANLFRGTQGFYSVQYNSNGRWMYITYSIIHYNDNGTDRIAYCIDPDLGGIGYVSDIAGYSVHLTELLSNNALWRVYRNGYPYCSPSQMGVETEDDAYLATKQAAYWVIRGRNLESLAGYFRAGQTSIAGEDLGEIQRRGQKVVDAINRLVTIAYTSSETPITNNIVSFNKSNGFIEDGNYYSQTYTVSSRTSMQSYTIRSVLGFPEGTIITDTNGNQKTTFAGGESFKLKVPKDKLTANIDGVINVMSHCATYPVYYGKSYNPDLQNYAVVADPYTDVSSTIPLNVKTNTGILKVNKTDDETNNPIEGVTFQLKKEDGTIIGNATTNNNGVATFSGLYQGNYILKEISTNENYVLNNAEFGVSIEYNKTTTKDISNTHKKGNIKVYKVDKDNNRVVLGNVKFDLFSQEFNKVIGTYTTDVNGELYIENIRTGNYKLIEKETNKWYNLAEDTDVEVEWKTTSENTITNELKKGQIKVIKVDLDNNEVKISGVKFNVLDKNNKILETITTDEKGEALTSKYAIRDYENLTLQEIETDERYVLNSETQTVKLEQDQIKDITFTNEKKKGQVRVIKVDLDNNEVKIPNVEFNVLDSNGKVVDKLITDKNGEATSKRLPIDQQYTLQETKTLENYVLNEETQTVTLTQDQITNITFTNEKKKGQVKVIKVDLDNNEVKIPNVEFNVLDSNGKVVDKLITDENGEAVSKRLPIDQQYTLQETKTLENYVLNEETQTVKLEQDQIKEITFTNEKIKGYIKVIKESKEDNKYNGDVVGTKLKNAEFNVYDESGNIVDKLVTDENGEATTKELLKGKYTIKETKSPDYYIITDEIFDAEIVKHQEIVNVTIKDDNVDIKVEVNKTGFIETQSKDNIYYDFANIHNNSNVPLDNFTWSDTLPIEAVRADRIFTGTYNEDLKYSIWYKTNKNEYKMLIDNLSTQVNNEISFKNIDLQEDEYITDYEFRFGTVKIGFSEIEKPRLYCDMLDNLGNGFIFTNNTKVSGNYLDQYVEDTDKWTTITYYKEIQLDKLPRTGC